MTGLRTAEAPLKPSPRPRRWSPRTAHQRRAARRSPLRASLRRRWQRLEDYLDLVAAVEAHRAGRLATPVILEGYEPPRDPRVRKFSVTPDPGVIEVNIQPASSWRAAGRADRHFLRGGARDAPVDREVHARRPPHRHRKRRQPPSCTGGADRRRLAVPAPARPARQHDRLLAQLHPALSYIFSGMFVGPTSQAPRIEQRPATSSVYEIEVAFAESWRPRRPPPKAGKTPPWLIDRAACAIC